MAGKVRKMANAAARTLKIEELLGQPKMALTEAEKINFEVLFQKATELQTQFQRIDTAIKGLVSTTVESRGLDPRKFGVNLAAGRILPIEMPASLKPSGDGRGDGNEVPEP